MRLFQVGGSIRDELLGVPSHDLDFSVEALSFEAMVEELEARGFRIWQTRPEYATVRAQFPDKGPSCDFVLARRDGFYSDGRRPDSIAAGSLYDDLARRDFTINAIAREWDIPGAPYIDPFGGLKDITSKLIQTVGDPAERITEDSLRALRALRFSVTLGFDIADDLRYVLKTERTSHALEAVAPERMHIELTKMIKADQERTLNIIREYPNLFRVVFSNRVGIWLKPTLEDK